VPTRGDTLAFRSDAYSAPVEDGGSLVNAQTAVLTVKLPDGTTATPSVSNPATGKYTASYVTTSASPLGRYVGDWLFTFAGGATTDFQETYDVGLSLVTLDEAVAHLRASGTEISENQLDQLEWLTFVATEAVELDLGRALTKQTVVETHNGGCGSLVLRKSPVVSIVSVTQSGQAVTDYLLDGPILHRSTWGWWQWGIQNIVVTYVAGYDNPPRIARKVALNAVQGMWQTSQQAPHPFVEGFNADDSVGLATATLTPLERNAYESLRVVGVA
jgi:hypothetical protein